MGCNNRIFTGEFVKIIVESDKETEYLSVDKLGDTQETEKFSTDSKIYTDDGNSFYSQVNSEGNKIENSVVSYNFTDENGNFVEADSTVKKIMGHIAKTVEHDIYKFQIVKNGEQYFAVAYLNVNLWVPCDLYYYDSDKDSISLVYEGDDVEIKGVTQINTK